MIINRSLDVLEHHFGELVKGNLTVTIGIDLLDDVVDDCLLKILTKGKDLLDLISGDGTTTIFIEHLERRLELVVGEEVLLVHGGNHEFGVINSTTAIDIDLIEHLIDFLVGHGLTEVLEISIFDLLLVELTVTVGIHGSEHFIDAFSFLLGEELTGNESKSCLLELGLSIELTEVGKCGHTTFFGDSFFLLVSGLLNPW